jgi:uncharacterized repeat protein (TIGR03803 family)
MLAFLTSMQFPREASMTVGFAAPWRLAVALAVCLIAGASTARAATEMSIYDFRGRGDGGLPEAGVIRDPAAEAAGIVPAGTLFGTTTSYGKHPGASGLGGTLFMLTPPAASGNAWMLTILHQFDAQSSDGFYPRMELTPDATGNLYGTTYYGGGQVHCEGTSCGSVFELSLPAAGGKWTYRVLHRFTGENREGAWPSSKLALDPSGSGMLYGTTIIGGKPSCPNGCGGVFTLTPPGVGGDTAGHWILHVIYEFDGKNGYQVAGTPIFDNASPPHLFDTTYYGGASYYVGNGTVFELLPPNSAGNPVSQWSERLIHSFKRRPTDGAEPTGLSIGGNGVLYGTTVNGGEPDHGRGTVFEFLPPALSTTGEWEEVLLHKFQGALHDDGGHPQDWGPLLDPATGKLYGTTQYGGDFTNLRCKYCGTVFELTATENPKVWNETVLAVFTGRPIDGSNPLGGLTFGADGNLYGTTLHGGLHNAGTVFQVTLP